MKKGSLSVLAITALTLVLLVSACGGTKATTSTAPPTTTTTPPTTTTTPPTTSTTGTPTTTTTTGTGATLSTTPIAYATHSAAQLASYKGLCQMCHAQGTTNSNPYPPTWDGKANGSTANPGVYTVVPGSVQDHSQYTVDQCDQAGCHVVPGSSTTPPTTTTTTPPTTTTGTPPTTTPTPTTTSTVKSGLQFVDISVDGFHPTSLAVIKGTTVTFTNNRESSTELVCDALEVDTTILRGLTFTYTFGVSGTYKFTTDENDSWVITVQ